MPFDPFEWIINLEKKSPRFAHYVAIKFLSRLSPFNRHLGAKMLEWSAQKCTIAVKRRRQVRNHVGSIHAGALFTLGETCAGLVIIRNFPFAKYRPLMSDVKVNYSKQARGDVVGECFISPSEIERMHREFSTGEVPSIEVQTNIMNDQKEIICVVTTMWQVKPWNLVKTKPL